MKLGHWAAEQLHAWKMLRVRRMSPAPSVISDCMPSSSSFILDGNRHLVRTASVVMTTHVVTRAAKLLRETWLTCPCQARLRRAAQELTLCQCLSF